MRHNIDLRWFKQASALRALACATLVAGSALFAGCKGNTSAAAYPETIVAKPPVVAVKRLPAALPAEMVTAVCQENPATGALWQSATWAPFVAPIGTAATTPATRGAFLYDDGNLYVAVICRKSTVISPEMSDSLSIFLETHDEGKELLQIAVNLDGAESVSDAARSCEPQVNWFRTTAPAQPLETGGPDFATPVDRRPNLRLPGIDAIVHEFSEQGFDAWSVVLKIPSASLPGPLRATPGGTPWKANLIRTLAVTSHGKRVQQTQSNLSPVYPAAQSVSPYRLATLEFSR
jgi:hypothetical protein